MKSLVVFTHLAILLWTCATVTAQDELNTTCTLTPVITDQLKKTLFEYFDKSSAFRLLEYEIVFDDSYTDQQNTTESAYPFENWRWFRTQEFGSVYFFFLDEYFWTFRILFGNIRSSVEIQFQVTPEHCFGNLSLNVQQTLIRNALISDFDLKYDLHKYDIEFSKNVEICLNNDKQNTFKHYRCCGFNRWNEYYCNDQSVYFKIVYFCVPFIISVPMAVSILYLLSFSYKSVRFECYKEADTEINELKKLKQKEGNSALGKITARKSQLMKIKNSTWPLFGYYIHKMKQKPLWKIIFYPDRNTPSIFTLIFESLLLNLPFLVLCAETFNANNYNWGVVCLIISIMNFFICVAFCYKQNVEYSFHRLINIKSKHVIKKIMKALFLLYNFVVFYFSILCYVKIMFTFIAFAFFEFEKADIVISIALVVAIYLYGVFEKTNSKLRKCLIDYKIAFNDMVYTNRQEKRKVLKFFLRIKDSGTENHESTGENKFNITQNLPLFYDTEGNIYIWKEFFYSCCHSFFKRQTKSWLKILAKASLCGIFFCYLLMLGMLVWYFEDFYDYSLVKTVLTIIAGGMLPKVLGMALGKLDSDVQLQKNEDGFLLLVQKEISDHNKMSSKNVLWLVGRTGHGKTSAIRSIFKDGTIVPDPSKTAPGASTTSAGTSKTAPGTSTTSPGNLMTQPGLEIATYTEDNLELIDGTGIGDNGKGMKVNAKDLVKSISRNLTNGFTALVFVIKYCVTFTKQETDAVEAVKSIFGNDVLKKWGIILMTYGDNFYLEHEDDPNSFKAWCQNQSGGFKTLFDECKGRCVLFNNKTSDPLELENQRELLMKQVEAVRECSIGPYTRTQFNRSEEKQGESNV